MSDQPRIQIDDDWKRQAQEEKRRLAEAAEKSKPTPGSEPPPDSPAAKSQPTPGRDNARRQPPPASFASLVQTFMTQTLLYLGELAVRGGEQMINLDMAKHQLDMLAVLETKTRGNLDADEQKLLDSVLYELRSRFVAVASQYIM